MIFKVREYEEVCVFPYQTELYEAAAKADRFYLEVKMAFAFHGIHYPFRPSKYNKHEFTEVIRSASPNMVIYSAFRGKYYLNEDRHREPKYTSFSCPQSRYNQLFSGAFDELSAEDFAHIALKRLEELRISNGYAAFE